MKKGMSPLIPLVAVGALFFYLRRKDAADAEKRRQAAIETIKKSGKDPFEGAWTKK